MEKKHKQALITALSSVLIAVLMLLSGCGGGGGASTPSPFAGHWIGTATTAGQAPATVDAVISSNGSIVGTSHDSSDNTDTNMRGTILSAGTVTVTLTLTGYEPAVAVGTMVIQGNGHLVGAIVNQQVGVGASVAFDLVKQ